MEKGFPLIVFAIIFWIAGFRTAERIEHKDKTHVITLFFGILISILPLINMIVYDLTLSEAYDNFNAFVLTALGLFIINAARTVVFVNESNSDVSTPSSRFFSMTLSLPWIISIGVELLFVLLVFQYFNFAELIVSNQKKIFIMNALTTVFIAQYHIMPLMFEYSKLKVKSSESGLIFRRFSSKENAKFSLKLIEMLSLCMKTKIVVDNAFIEKIKASEPYFKRIIVDKNMFVETSDQNWKRTVLELIKNSNWAFFVLDEEITESIIFEIKESVKILGENRRLIIATKNFSDFSQLEKLKVKHIIKLKYGFFSITELRIKLFKRLNAAVKY